MNLRTFIRVSVFIGAFNLAALPPAALAVSTTWSGSGNWTNSANWSGGVPDDGYEVVLSSGTCLLSSSTRDLASLAIDGGAILTFTNWDTMLIATNVTIQNGGNMTHAACNTNPVVSNTNRVHISCSNLTIAAGGSINVNAKGYKGGTTASYPGQGPGGGAKAGTLSGAGYGGQGGIYNHGLSGFTYGSADAPEHLGSGGGGAGDGNGTFGGGAVRIEATGAVLVNGSITADGEMRTAAHDGSGSGGGIYITCHTFAGTNGLVSAQGGKGIVAYNGGNGGGGRVAVIYNASAQSNMPKPRVLFSAEPGLRGYGDGDIGSIYFTDTSVLDATWLPHTGQVWGVKSWSLANLTLSNGWLRFAEEGFQLTVTNDVRVIGSARLEVGGNRNLAFAYVDDTALYSETNGPRLYIGGDLVLTNGGTLKVYGGITNAVITNYSALVSVTGDVFIDTNSWIYPYSHPTNGGSVLFRMRNLTIASTTNGGINADYRGFSKGLPYVAGWPTPPSYPNGYGPGRGQTLSGGGYGGNGSNYLTYLPGGTYGSSNAPVDPGSGGGGQDNISTHFGGNGGGLIRIEAAGTVSANGLITARGQSAGSGGSGGGIFIKCQTFTGDTNGALRAAAGGGGYAGGGGGRIAVWRILTRSNYQGIYSATGGVPGGSSGTVALVDMPDRGGLLIIIR